jgi:hypothetical protein
MNDGSARAEDRPKGFFGLEGALRHFGENAIDVEHKKDMRKRIVQGPPFTAQERADILAYNLEDVTGLACLVAHIIPTIRSLPHAMHRASYMWAVAKEEQRGIPIDAPALGRIQRNWDAIQVDLVTEIDAPFNCYEIRGGQPHWVKEKFAACVRRRRLPWPKYPGGALDETAETFKEMGKAFPEIEPLRELRSSLSKLRLSGLQIGHDGRNRTLLSPFGSKTSRNQPSATKYIFGPAKWLRFFISPPPGWALIHRDYSQQEVCIAAWMSQDHALLAACATGDVYLGIAKQLGFIPEDATAESHPDERALFKTVVLGIQYGLGFRSLAMRTGISLFEAGEILNRLRARYRTFEEYVARVADQAGLFMEIGTAFGWRMKCPPAINPRTVRNFMFQATGGEVLRAASILGERRGLQIVAPVHDAILAQCPLNQVEESSLELDRCMRDASNAVLRGYELRTESQIIKPGGHYFDKRGIQMWTTVNKLVTKLEQGVA